MAVSNHQQQNLSGEGLFEEMVFHPSATCSLGVELELQILDRQSGELAPGSVRIVNASDDARITGVGSEFLLSMLEVRTGICQSVREVESSLVAALRRVKNLAASLGYDLAWGGTHPLGRASMSAVSPDDRYQRIQKQQGWMAYQEPVFGLHVHVGVPNETAALGTINLLIEYLPHLLALSANSPFWQGVDTGHASARVRVFRPSAHSGVPPHFADWQAFRHFCMVMHGAGAIASTKDIHWDIRPRPTLGTIEFRICDMPPTLDALLGLVALIRGLVREALGRLDERPELGEGKRERFWLATENRWRAARYGLRAVCQREPEGRSLSLADDVAQLVERLLPSFGETSEAGYVDALFPPAGIQTGADRQRAIYRQTGDWRTVVDDLRKRWAQGLERRVEPARDARADAFEDAAGANLG